MAFADLDDLGGTESLGTKPLPAAGIALAHTFVLGQGRLVLRTEIIVFTFLTNLICGVTLVSCFEESFANDALRAILAIERKK